MNKASIKHHIRFEVTVCKYMPQNLQNGQGSTKGTDFLKTAQQDNAEPKSLA